MLRLGELKVETQVVKEDLKDKAEARKETASFQTELSRTCDSKQQAWNDYQASQAEEIKALTETVEFLEKDDVRQTIGDAARETSLTQFSASRSRAMVSTTSEPLFEGSWMSFLQLSNAADMEDQASSAERLNFAEMALRGDRRGLDMVVKKIEELHVVLDKEAASDEEKRKYCEKKLRQAEMDTMGKRRDMEDTKTIMGTYENERKTVIDEIQSLEANIKELDEQVAEITGTRKAEHEEFVKARDTNNAALELLDVAARRIQQYYSSSFVQVAGKAEHGTASHLSRAEARAAPEADLTYRKQSEASTRLIMLFNHIKADVQKQTAALKSEDVTGQKEYEGIVANSNDKKTIINKSLGNKQAAKAELEVTIQRSREELRSHQQALLALAEETQTLHADCDFLVKNFDVRRRAKTMLEASGDS